MLGLKSFTTMLRFLSILLFSTIFISLPLTETEAQYRSRKKQVKHRFNAGFSLGASFSQIDGDKYTGFDKAGIRLGVNGSMYLNHRLDLVMGLYYNQQGSARSILNESRGNVIHLDYMEVPLLLSFRASKKDKNKCVLLTGFSYGRLINQSIKERIRSPRNDIKFTALSEHFNSNEYNVVFGMDYFVSQNIGFGFAYTFQLNRLYRNTYLDAEELAVLLGNFNTNATSEVLGLRNYQIAVHMVYSIF